MARRDYYATALVPHGHHQNWDLFEKIARELERVTDQWPEAETKFYFKGKRDLYGKYDTLIDAQIDLGDDRRDVTSVDIARYERDGDYPDTQISVTLAKNQKDTSWVYASGPVKRTCEEFARTLQTFILHTIKHPESTTTLPQQKRDAIAARLQHLHPAIKPGALARLSSGHGDEAVVEACQSVGARLQQLSGLDDDGASLVSRTLGKQRIIAVNDGVKSSEISEQEGYMHLGMALFRAARNPRAHRPSDPDFDTDEVIEWLSVASALHRALDRATVTPPSAG
ncbi:TIGR02391 family protein [Streptomyces sp. NEAU-YJ-81]|uniref:TIGR02391 family protein n=1 Tax=Streptomyces sp. NEAU-YJ-81 TaxID=2820288 RepID=UPI001ABC8D2F|nr:TIGR02391 family protein [Streptomyces sp. NEAU-YJ-81]MBO3673535.1 TIGR02391 family protein [Streptomyces sp. NEAU-YJ-81]